MKIIRDIIADQFVIPWYQRDYAWEKEHVIALIDDFIDSMNGSYTHYVSSIILMSREKNRKDLIDGQQRLTTIVMLLKALADELDDESFSSKSVIQKLWSVDNKGEFIFSTPGEVNVNVKFLEMLLLDVKMKPKTQAQTNYERQYRNIQDRLRDFDTESIPTLIDTILNSEATIHEVNNIIEANRIFLTLNSRGKPLTYAEKIKALLIYHAAKIDDPPYPLSERVHEQFCKVTSTYHDINNAITINRIKIRTDGGIDEDMLLGWHYCFLRQRNNLPTAKVTFGLIRDELNACTDPDVKREFIERYISSVVSFFSAFEDIIHKSTQDALFYEIIVICRLSAYIWPALVALQHRGLLEGEFPLKNNPLKLIKLMQLIDKVHRLSNVQGIGVIRLSHQIFNEELSPRQIIDALVDYHNEKWFNPPHTLPFEFIESKQDYISYLLFDATTDDCKRSNIDFLRAYKKINATPIQVLTIAPNMRIRDFGIGKRIDIGSVCNSLGNYVLIPGELIDDINVFIQGRGNPLPTELKEKFLALENTDCLQNTHEVFELIEADTDMNREFIENRYAEIFNRLTERWISPFTVDAE